MMLKQLPLRSQFGKMGLKLEGFQN